MSEADASIFARALEEDSGAVFTACLELSEKDLEKVIEAAQLLDEWAQAAAEVLENERKFAAAEREGS